VWDASTGEVLNVLEGHTDDVTSVAFSSDDRRIVSGSGDKSVRVWDASTGETLKVLDGHSSYVRSVAYSSDDRCIVSGSSDKSVRVWDASTGETLKVLHNLPTSCARRDIGHFVVLTLATFGRSVVHRGVWAFMAL